MELERLKHYYAFFFVTGLLRLWTWYFKNELYYASETRMVLTFLECFQPLFNLNGCLLENKALLRPQLRKVLRDACKIVCFIRAASMYLPSLVSFYDTRTFYDPIFSYILPYCIDPAYGLRAILLGPVLVAFLKDTYPITLPMVECIYALVLN